MRGKFIGQVLLDQYRVDAFIDSGGMGAVYRVWDLKRNVSLAMKVLHGELADDPHIFKRFQREANALKRLTHPNIVQFYGLFQTLDFAFLLERFVDGPTLKDILRQQAGKPLPIREVLTYLKALCSALGYAHANRVVHCDVKPGNVLVDQGGNIYLTDFGIARHAESTTTTMANAGTAAYMAPEQISGKSVTPATDVYALGVILFEMVTGQRPFRGTEQGTEKGGQTANERIRYAHLHSQPPAPRTINPSLSQELEQVILKTLNKNPTKRYLSTQEFLNAISTASDTVFSQIPDRTILPSEFQDNTADNSQPQVHPRTKPVTPQASRSFLPWLIGSVTILFLGFALISFRQPRPLTAPTQHTAEATNVASTSPESIDQPVNLQSTESLPTSTPVPTDTKISISTLAKPSSAEIAYVIGAPEIDGSIYIVDANGSNQGTLVNNNCNNAEPDWSSDGTLLIYQSNCGGSYDIWRINAKGTDQEALIGNQAFDEREAHFANTGDEIVYVRHDAGEPYNANGDIRVYELSGRDISTGLKGRGPVFSPDDSQLAFMALEGKYWQIFLYSFSTGKLQQITSSNSDCRWPAWSPDGQYIAYSSAIGGGSNPTGIWKISASGGNPKPVITNGDFGRPSWSDNGFIVFNSGGGLWVIRPDGKGLRQLTSDKGWAAAWSR